MGEPQRRRRRGSGEDRISGLPDALLHEILVRQRSAAAAARTSVLSRRWRHLWAHMPELLLVAPREADPGSFPATVDAALGGYLAPTLEHLGVSHYTGQIGRDLHIPAGRIAPWLHFAAEHMVREVNLNLRVPQRFVVMSQVIGEEAVLELPVCEGAKRIELHLQYAYTTWLGPQAPGLFKALTHLKIGGYVHMEGSDVTTLVSTQCPCLRDLNLAIELTVIFDVFIHSNSMHTLVLRVLETRRLEILAPRLEELTIIIGPKEAHISAPKLVKVDWRGVNGYDPHLHRFVDVGRRLQLLRTSIQAFSLTKWLDEVDDLDLSISLRFPDVARYESFLNETDKLPKCKSFIIMLGWEHHALVPIMLRLLRGCIGTKKFRIHLSHGWPGPVSCQSSCPCRIEESRKIDGIDLSSLEVVEIRGFEGSREQIEFVEFLSSNAGVLKRLLINDEYCRTNRKGNVREKVRSMCRPNVKVEFPVLRDEREEMQRVIDEGRLIALD